jgi:CheY-like chemotaxis protein
MQVELDVVDSGQGIAPEFLPHVFDRFRQADSSTQRQHAGLGLGLAIVKQLVELHGGTIRAESAGLNKGATFRMILPVGARGLHTTSSGLKGERPAGPRAEEQSPVLSGLTILVVDDDADSRQFVSRVLQNGGATVVEASSAPAAVEMVARDHPDVLLSDIGMPQLRAGFQSHIAKPVDSAELLAVVAALAGRSGD